VLQYNEKLINKNENFNMRVKYESKLYVPTTNSRFEIGLYTKSNINNTWLDIITCGLKGKISRLIPKDSFTIRINPHNSSEIDPKNNPNIIIKFQNDAHAQLIASKLMLHIYHSQALYRPVRNSTTLQISDPDLTIAKKIGSGEYNHILFPKQSCKPQKPRVDRMTTGMDMFPLPLTFCKLAFFQFPPLNLNERRHFDQIDNVVEMDTADTHSPENGQLPAITKS
jgi:hypothetical protein